MSERETRAATIFDRDESRSGSVQHFAHFMKDYFIEIAVWCADHPGQPIIVRECGPCTPWFDKLTTGNEVTVVSRAELTQLAEAHPEQVYLVRKRVMKRPKARQYLPRFRALFATRTNNPQNRVFAVRSLEPDFYFSAESENQTAGPMRRRLGNEQQLATFLRRLSSFRVVEFFEKTPRESIDLMQGCSIFVAQRGAAMMNLLFMPAGASVVEIYPKDMDYGDQHADLYRRACDELGLKYVRIQQKTKFSHVSPLRLVYAILRVTLSRAPKG